MQGTTEFLAWICARFDTIDDLIASLHEERCEAAKVYVLRVKEHYEALDAIAMLKYDLTMWEQAKGTVDFVQLEEMPSYNRLLAYTNMFKDNALKDFEQLASTSELAMQDDYMGDYMGVDRRDAGDYSDNTRGEQVLEDFDSGKDERDLSGSLVDRMLKKLDDLEAHLKESLDNLRDGEIRAAHETVAYIQEAEKEVAYL